MDANFLPSNEFHRHHTALCLIKIAQALLYDKASLCINSSASPVPRGPQGAISLNCRKQMKKEGEMNAGDGEREREREREN